MRKPLRFTAHARVAMEERKLEREWVERAVYTPEWQERDPHDPSISRRFAAIPERGSRFLRVALVESSHRNPYTDGVSRPPCEEAMMSPTVKYDADANAAYIRFSPQPVEESEEVSDGIVIDFDAEGRIVGLEVLDARAHLPPDLLTRAA